MNTTNPAGPPEAVPSEPRWRDVYDFLSHVRKSAITMEKADFILGHCRGRDVLDVGCVDHTADAADQSNWLHARLVGVARSCQGIDTAEEEVARLAAKGYRVLVGDVEQLDLEDRFDVIVAGDVVEHLSNPGLFLSGARRHLRSGGVLVLTTPNAHSADQFARALVANYTAFNPQHTACFDPAALWELASRNGLEVAEFAWLRTSYRIRELARTPTERLVGRACEAVVRLRRILTQDFGFVLREHQGGDASSSTLGGASQK